MAARQLETIDDIFINPENRNAVGIEAWVNFVVTHINDSARANRQPSLKLLLLQKQLQH